METIVPRFKFVGCFTCEILTNPNLKVHGLEMLNMMSLYWLENNRNRKFCYNTFVPTEGWYKYSLWSLPFPLFLAEKGKLVCFESEASGKSEMSYCLWYWSNVMVNLALTFGGLFCSIMELNRIQLFDHRTQSISFLFSWTQLSDNRVENGYVGRFPRFLWLSILLRCLIFVLSLIAMNWMNNEIFLYSGSALSSVAQFSAVAVAGNPLK